MNLVAGMNIFASPHIIHSISIMSRPAIVLRQLQSQTRAAVRTHSNSSTAPTPSQTYLASATAGPSRQRADPLDPANQQIVERIVRVDHAGELGANWIYRGQKWGSMVRGDAKTVKQIEAS